ncbi:MAG: glycosyltransferase [Candidatus Eisenbacteria bacterium]
MRVLQFGKFYPPDIGGIERVMFDITEGLNARDVRCDVLCSNSEKKYVEETVGKYRVTRTRSYGRYFSTSISPQLAFKLKAVQGDYDIIHVHLPDPIATLALFAARPRSRVILHWHNDIVRQRFLLKLFLPFQSWMTRRADAIITTSPNYIVGSPFLARHRAKCHVVPIGVDKSSFRVSDQAASEIRKRYRDRRIVFAVGRLSRYKGYQYLIRAARLLSDQYVVLIGGSGPLDAELAAQIQREGLGDKVFLLGRIDHEDLGSYYEACDLFCLSSISRNEGFGLVQLEAMLFKKPVVSTNIKGSGVTWANLNGETGLVVEPADPTALAKAIERICSDRDLYNKFARVGFDRTTREFSKERMLSAVTDLYETVMSGSSKRKVT